MHPNLEFIIKKAKNIGFDVSIISNAYHLGFGLYNVKIFDSQKWIERNAHYLCMFGISIDSICKDTNIKIGRCTNDKKTLTEWQIYNIAKTLKEYNKKLEFKINTVITALNYDEDFGDFICTLMPDKWKILQALSINTQKVLCKEWQYKHFLDKHHNFDNIIVEESKTQMMNSYVMIDPFGRFFQNQHSIYSYSPFILNMNSDEILKEVCFDDEKFQKRYSKNNKN